jgi:hypothetical protein
MKSLLAAFLQGQEAKIPFTDQRQGPQVKAFSSKAKENDHK